MESYKIYEKGNYIIIENADKDGIYSGLKKDVLIDKNNIKKPIYKIYNVKDWDSFKSLDLSQILKEDSTNYTESEWETFYQNNTGNFNSGSALDPQILDALVNSNSPSNTNPFVTLNDIQISSLDSVVVNVDGTLTINYNGTESISTVKSVLDIRYNVLNYTTLLSVTPSPSLYDFAYVREEQGTKWLPGSLLGTYYGAGLYMWNGTAWIESKTNIYNELNSILLNKADKKETEINIKTISELLALHPPNINNEVQLDKAVYKIDSTEFDVTGYTLLGNINGTTIAGYSQNINVLKSTQDNISLIKSSGNLFIKHLQIEASGLNSVAIEMNGATGGEAVDLFYVSFINCTKIGVFNSIRQVFVSSSFTLGCSEGILLKGNWGGGFTLFNSRIINTGQYILKGDAGFTCTNIRSNVNATIPSGAVAFDFDYGMITIDSGYQLEGGRYDGLGEMVSSFTTGDTLITKNSRKSYFRGNKGSKGQNTYIGTEWIVTSQVITPLTLNVLTKLLGTTTYSNEVHFMNSTNNAPYYNSSIIKDVDITGSIYLLGGANDIVDLYIRKWDNSATSYVDLQIVRRLIINSQAGEDVGEYNFFLSTVMEELDRIELWVVNLTDNDDITMINTSKLKISERP